MTNFFSFRLFERHIKVRRKMSSECVAMQWHYSRHIHYLIIASNGTTACSKYINRLVKCVHSVSLWIGLFTAKCQFTSVALHSIFILMETLDVIRISYAPETSIGISIAWKTIHCVVVVIIVVAVFLHHRHTVMLCFIKHTAFRQTSYLICSRRIQSTYWAPSEFKCTS